jgi:hypothetical protein
LAPILSANHNDVVSSFACCLPTGSFCSIPQRTRILHFNTGYGERMNKMYVLVVCLSLTFVATAQNLPDAPSAQKSTLTKPATDPVWPRYDRLSLSRSQNSGDDRQPFGQPGEGDSGQTSPLQLQQEAHAQAAEQSGEAPHRSDFLFWKLQW